MILVSLFLALSSPDDAARAEEAAFIAIEEKRWCDAWRDFMRAHELAPADELLFNAALAAERAGDVEKARALFERVPPSSPKGESARRHLADLQNASSTAICEGKAQTATAAVEEKLREEARNDGRDEELREQRDDGRDDGRDEGRDDGRDDRRTSRMGTLPLGLAGAAGVVTLAGALAIAASTAVYYDHQGAREAILAGEAAGAEPATLLDEHDRQREARAAWESWGASAMIGGAAAIVIGLGVGALAISMGVE